MAPGRVNWQSERTVGCVTMRVKEFSRSLNMTHRVGNRPGMVGPEPSRLTQLPHLPAARATAGLSARAPSRLRSRAHQRAAPGRSRPAVEPRRARPGPPAPDVGSRRVGRWACRSSSRAARSASCRCRCQAARLFPEQNVARLPGRSSARHCRQRAPTSVRTLSSGTSGEEQASGHGSGVGAGKLCSCRRAASRR